MDLIEATIYKNICIALIAIALVSFVTLFFVVAPYGRYHSRDRKWGPTVNSRFGWFLMELPSVVVFAWIFSFGSQATQVIPLILFSCWQIHYIHRGLLFPLRLGGTRKRIPVIIVMLGFSFNTVNSYINARWISELGVYSSQWITHPIFICGITIFAFGFILNLQSDSILLRLRTDSSVKYKIPFGGAFRWVSSPNYLGEILEWLGWAIMTWSLSGLTFFIFSAANLIPRAYWHHRWYREKFSDYPKNRKCLVPYVY